MGCEIQKDPSDNCCEMLVCHGKPLESGTRKDDSTTLDDGCVYKNKTYARDEKFYDGCESQCMCFSNGDVTCQPRYKRNNHCFAVSRILHLKIQNYVMHKNPTSRSDSALRIALIVMNMQDIMSY